MTLLYNVKGQFSGLWWDLMRTRYTWWPGVWQQTSTGIYVDVMGTSWWRHQMETFSALLALCAGNSPVPVNSPHKGQWRVALMFSLICARINDWVNNREAGDLRRYRGHYDVIVMMVPGMSLAAKLSLEFMLTYHGWNPITFIFRLFHIQRKCFWQWWLKCVWKWYD